jgi:hypothetical protein
MKIAVTPEIMTKVWKLHNKGVDERLIAETLGISYNSALRIVKIMTAAQNGEDVDSIGGNNYQKQKLFAKKFFGIIVEKKEEVEEQKELECVSSVADMQKLLAMLAWQNELLETLLLSLGVDWKTKCKGVERR